MLCFKGAIIRYHAGKRLDNSQLPGQKLYFLLHRFHAGVNYIPGYILIILKWPLMDKKSNPLPHVIFDYEVCQEINYIADCTFIQNLC